MLPEHFADARLILRRAGGAEGQRQFTQAKLKEPVAFPALVVVILFGNRLLENLQLPLVEAQGFVDLARPLLHGVAVGQKDARWTVFYDGRGDGAVRNVRETLRGEDDRHVLFAQDLEPLTYLGGKQ